MHFTEIDRKFAAIGKELENDLNNSDAWAAKAELLSSIGLHENALRCCERSLAINPDNAFTWAIKGNALDKLGRLDEAKEAFAKAKEIGYPGNPAQGNFE